MRPHCTILAALLLATAALAQQPAEDVADTKAKAVVAYTPAFSCYVFTGAPFPTLVYAPNTEALEKLLGPCTVKIAFYDRDHREVTQADRPGPYGAVVQLSPKLGPPVRRFVTLCRIDGEVKADQRFDPATISNLRQPFGLPEGALHREEKLAVEVLKARAFSEWSRDARAARLFAGLFLGGSNDKPRTKADDALARERQWWVDLKRKIYGWDKGYAKPFVAPVPLEGKRAPVVRPGTPAEAGMKPDAADKIDAVLQAFAADTDQAFAVCIVRHGVVVLHKAYGERDGKPMTVDTKSWMASITKTMAATTMLMLIDQGLVSFDDPVEKFLPPLRGLKVGKPLLVRNLYTHTNGIEKLPWNDEMSDIEERLAAYYERAKVGQVWAYGGNGNILGGKIIEAVTGEAVPLFYKHHLLDPLGCTGTEVIGTHGDARSIPLDMAKFGQLLLNRGDYGAKRFVKPETFEQMLPRILTKELGPETKKSFGFGLDGNAKKFGHGAASAATFSVDTEADMVVIMTRDKQGKNQDKYNGKFWEAIRAGMEK